MGSWNWDTSATDEETVLAKSRPNTKLDILAEVLQWSLRWGVYYLGIIPTPF